MRAVNLLPKDAERAARVAPNPVLLVACAGAAVMLAVLFSMYMSASSSLSDAQVEEGDLAAQLRVYRPKEPALPIQKDLAQAEPQREAAMAEALTFRVPWDLVLKDISLALPSDVWLSDLTAEAPSSPTAVAVPGAASSSAKAGTLLMNGYTYSQEGVALLLKRLTVLPSLADVTLVSSQLSGGEATAEGGETPEVYQFSISARLRKPGEVS